MGTWATPESTEDIKNAHKAIDKLEVLKADLYNSVGDDELYSCLDSSIIRIKAITQEAESKIPVIAANGGDVLEVEDVETFIGRLRKEGKSRDEIVEQVRIGYRMVDDAEDVVDTYLQYHEGLELKNGGFFSLFKRDVNVIRLFKAGGTTGTGSSSTIFSAAKSKVTGGAKKEKGASYPVVVLSEKQFPNISAQLERIMELRSLVDDLEGEQKMVEGVVKGIAKDEFIKLYKDQKRNPDTFLMKGELGGCIMVIPTDRYLSIDADRATQLEASVRPDAIDEQTTYSFNLDVLRKYEKEISDMIKNNTQISQEDKDRLIVANVKYTVKKGSIDRLYEWFGDKLEGAFRSIEPVFQMKKCSR